MMLDEKRSRDLTPMDVRLLEPDHLGAITVVLYGRGPVAADRIPSAPQGCWALGKRLDGPRRRET